MKTGDDETVVKAILWPIDDGVDTDARHRIREALAIKRSLAYLQGCARDIGLNEAAAIISLASMSMNDALRTLGAEETSSDGEDDQPIEEKPNATLRNVVAFPEKGNAAAKGLDV